MKPDTINRVLKRNGLERTRKGKHGWLWVHPDDPTRRTQVPTHDEVADGTFAAIVRDAKKSREEFRAG
ncbi:MAG: type II toxin-antitoxin system HicA family toxin [Armatimonadetes bacterium]|nr:type II toxin-antitoxin system HicA family toxin [Armatimonadota bacterium]